MYFRRNGNYRATLANEGVELMYLHELLDAFSIQNSYPSIQIRGVETNSRRVQPGDVFFALTGHTSNGHDYIDQAVAAGAVAVVGTQECTLVEIPYIRVADTRKAVALAAKRFYNHPSSRKVVIGITGTNGKTTTSFLLREMLEQAGKRCALFGTVHYVINGKTLPSPNTTPDSLQFQRLLHESEDDVVIMEVSSHGIDQLRIEGIEFDFAVFTNLDQDHLDYHGTMDAYFEVKSRLFNQLKSKGTAVVWSENAWGSRLADQLKARGVRVIAVDKRNMEDSLQSQHLPFHNRINAELAATIAIQMGCSKEGIQQALHSFQGVPGRFELIEVPNDIHVVIDYAHTADAFNQVLSSVRNLAKGRILHVFGFRGNRDASKRQAMIEASLKGSDLSILTSDDRNGVSQLEMESQLDKLEFTGKRIQDRTEAIGFALEQAVSGDWIVITGKGNEPYKDDYEAPCQSDRETVEWYQKQEKIKL